MKIAFIVLSVFFCCALKAQNINKSSVDSLKQKVSQILENAFDSGDNNKYDISVEYYCNYKGEIALIKRAANSFTVDDFGITFSDPCGVETLYFSDTLRIFYQKWDKSSVTDKKRSNEAFEIVALKTKKISLYFYSSNYNRNNYEENFPRVQNIAKEFFNSFNLLHIECNRAYEIFEQNYRHIKSMGINNTIAEGQRKLIVQANYFNDKRDYPNALEFYDQAMQLSPFSYPEAYYNMALITAEMKNYFYAILNMRKYLLLMPDAEDARKAQDKIYEWELNIK